MKERKLEIGTKKKTKRVQTLFFLVLRIQRAYLIILLEKGGIIHKIWFSNVDYESGEILLLK